ncbi:transposase [Microbacterium sp.]|uniref:transposase n=1 Tax=Microbacterium sp. TaxID=51671 RepID=UPI00262F091D|nr:transposase [Microbacterium sp.]
MTLGLAPRQPDLLRSTANFCEGRVAPDSIYAVLHRECFSLFPDEMFADLFTDVGRRSVPPMIVAVVMVLQRIEGCSDREAVDRFAFDARWKYAAGGLDFDYPGFVHTVLVDMRARLARSARPNRIFQVTLEAARKAGLVGRRRVLDSTPLYDAVATMDTVTLVRSAIRGLLKVAEADLQAELRAVLARADEYADAGKPVCDWEDPAAREALVDTLAKDARAALAVLDGRQLDPAVTQAGQLLATVVGQDLDEHADGVFRIARRVAPDRVISTVDPEARHGHKTSARGFDGCVASARSRRSGRRAGRG